jgi:hypothetical protein
MRRGAPHRTALAAGLAAAVLVLQGCSGGSVAIRSGFPAPAAPPSPPVGGAQPGLTVKGGDGLALAIVLGLAIADGVHWLASRLSGDEAPAAPRRPLLQPIDRGWVDRGP